VGEKEQSAGWSTRQKSRPTGPTEDGSCYYTPKSVRTDILRLPRDKKVEEKGQSPTSASPLEISCNRIYLIIGRGRNETLQIPRPTPALVSGEREGEGAYGLFWRGCGKAICETHTGAGSRR